jgi:excinuclease ABC subunit C
VLEAAIQQFYELRGAPPEIHVPAEPTSARRSRAGCRSARPARAHRRPAARREARLRRSREPQRRARVSDALQPGQTAQYDALETLQHVLGLPALPRRIECFDISTIQGQRNRGVDGRLRRRADDAVGTIRKFKIRGLEPGR